MTLAKIFRHVSQNPDSLDSENRIVWGLHVDGRTEWKLSKAKSRKGVRLFLADGYQVHVGRMKDLRDVDGWPVCDLRFRGRCEIFKALEEISQISRQEASR